MTWRGACLWGMASGVGFGLAEGVLYAGQSYNGVAPAGIYLVRFASCVALHAVWSGSVGITVFLSRRPKPELAASLFDLFTATLLDREPSTAARPR